MQRGGTQPACRQLEVRIRYGNEPVGAQVEMGQVRQVAYTGRPLGQSILTQVQAAQLGHLAEVRREVEFVVAEVQHPEVFETGQFAGARLGECQLVHMQFEFSQFLQVKHCRGQFSQVGRFHGKCSQFGKPLQKRLKVRAQKQVVRFQRGDMAEIGIKGWQSAELNTADIETGPRNRDIWLGDSLPAFD